MSELSPEFFEAADYLSNSQNLSKVSNSTKLELYGLYKYLTVNKNPDVSRPSIFDMTGRAKWDAWQAAGTTYGDDIVTAEKKYMEIAGSLGWNGEETVERVEHGIEENKHSKSDGMGLSVSTMASSTQSPKENTLHGLAVQNDLDDLRTLINSQSVLDINERDEYGYTALQLAADRGNTEIVKLLIDRGANPMLRDPDNLTAVELASEAGHSDIVQLMT